MNGDPFEKFRDSPLAHPDENSVKDAGGKHHLGTQFSTSDLLSGVIDTDSRDIIRAVDEDYVHESHAHKERDQSQAHDPILWEQLVAPDLSAYEASDDHNRGETRRPPAVQQSRPVLDPSARLWWCTSP